MFSCGKTPLHLIRFGRRLGHYETRNQFQRICFAGVCTEVWIAVCTGQSFKIMYTYNTLVVVQIEDNLDWLSLQAVKQGMLTLAAVERFFAKSSFIGDIQIGVNHVLPIWNTRMS